MYIIIYPLFALLLKLFKKLLSKSTYYVAIFAFIMALLVGNLIDLPMLLFSKAVTIAYIIIGFKTTLIQGGTAFVLILMVYEPLSLQFNKLIEKGDIYV